VTRSLSYGGVFVTAKLVHINQTPSGSPVVTILDVGDGAGLPPKRGVERSVG
jgi:hypothetical protein